MRRVAILSTASGNGKTTVGRALAAQLGVPFHELDALHHGPDWTEATPEELRTKVEPIVESEAWVIDGAYRGKLGDLVLEGADLVVWLDLPLERALERRGAARDRIERRDLEFQRAVARGYARYAERSPGVVRVEASGAPEDIAAAVLREVTRVLH